MSNSARQRIQRLLASIGSKPAQQTPEMEASEYNWRQPHYFSSEQLRKLESFSAKLAQNYSIKLTELYHSSCNVKVVSTTQHFAGDFASADDRKSDYYLAFGLDNKQVFGFVGLPLKTAVICVKQLLGDTGSENENSKDLSPLEKSLLLDVVSGTIGAFSNTCENSLSPSGKLVVGELPVKLQNDQELCKITLQVELAGANNSAEAYFLMLCNRLEAFVGQKTPPGEDSAAKDVTKVMLSHVHKVPVNVTAQLARTELTFEEISGLNADDVLLLDKKVGTPVELIIDGRIFFKGMLAKSDGKQAIIITERCVGK